MMRRGVLNVLARMLTAWILLTVQGVCDTAHFAGFALAPSAVPLACAAPLPSHEESEARYSKLCRCRMCRGPKHCCCDTATDDSQRVAFRAVCDSPEDKIISGAVSPNRALPPVPTMIARCWNTTVSPLTPRPCGTYQPRCPEPVTPPPSV